MRRFIVPMVLLSTLGMIALPAASIARAAQPQRPASAKQLGQATATAVATSAGKRAATGTVRLPRYFGKLQLDDLQRTKVRQVEQSYQTRSRQLLAELKKLRADRDKQLAAVLTAAQQKTLADLLTRRGRSVASKKKAAATGKPSATGAPAS